MSTTYFELSLDPEFQPHKGERILPSETLTLTRFARAYQEGKPVPSGIQITLGKDYFPLTFQQVIELTLQLLKAHSLHEPIKSLEERD